MQILYQKKNGDRIPLTQEMYDVLRLRYGKQLSYIVRTKTLTICCQRGNERAWDQSQSRSANKLGGGDRMRNPYDYLS